MIDPTACKVISVVATFAWLLHMVTDRAWISRRFNLEADEYPTLYHVIVPAKVALLFYCFSPALCCAADDAAPAPTTLKDVVSAHADGRDRVTALEATLHLTAVRTRSSTIATPFKFATWTWSYRPNGHEWISSVAFAPPSTANAGAVVDHRQEFFDGANRWVLRNYNPKTHVHIEVPGESHVRAHVEPLTDEIVIQQDPAVYLLRALSIPLGTDRRWLLEEFVEKSPNARLVGVLQIGESMCWQISLDHPGIGGPGLHGTTCDIFIDPAVGYSICKVIERVRQGDRRDLEVEREVVRFVQFGSPAVFLPVEVLVRTHGADPTEPPETIVEVQVDEIRINEQLSGSAIEFLIPENVLVTHTPPLESGFYETDVWGPDSSPAFTFSDPADFEMYLESRGLIEAQTLPKWQRITRIIVLVLLALGVLIGLAAFSRRWFRRA
jgi:hypothetical protein